MFEFLLSEILNNMYVVDIFVKKLGFLQGSSYVSTFRIKVLSSELEFIAHIDADVGEGLNSVFSQV